MADWAKVKFLWDTPLGKEGSTLVATTTEPAGDYDVDYIHNWLETKSWKAADAITPMYIILDAGVGNTEDADYFAILRHNLNTIGATIVLQHSTDNFAADINDAFIAFTPTTDLVQLKEFTAPGAKRYWRLKITGTLSEAPFMAIAVWGLKTELKWASDGFAPDAQDDQMNVNESYGGYVTGIHLHHTKRTMALKFANVDATLYAKFEAWREGHGPKQFFVAWETANKPDEVFLMRPSNKFDNPYRLNGRRRTVTVNLVGRKEG